MEFKTDPLVAQLFDALEESDTAKVKALLQQGADPNGLDYSDGYTPLSLAVESQQPEMIRMMLEHGADPNRGGIVVPTLDAVERGRLDILKLLLEFGGNPHHEDEEGETALAWAERNNNSQAVELIKEFLEKRQA